MVLILLMHQFIELKIINIRILLAGLLAGRRVGVSYALYFGQFFIDVATSHAFLSAPLVWQRSGRAAVKAAPSRPP